MGRALRLATMALVLALAAGCVETSRTTDGPVPSSDVGARLDAVGADAGGPKDASVADGSTLPMDAEVLLDATSDAGNADAAPIDAAAADAANADANPNADATSLDAAPIDATTSDAGTQTGLEWDGEGTQRRMLYWHNPFPIYDATYVFKVYPRRKNNPNIPNYYTTFFWGNDGTFIWDNGNANTYYGAHPYPIPAPTGPGQWEISIRSNDYVTGTEVDWDRWHTQAFRAWRSSATTTHHEFYYDLPDTSRVISVDIDDASWAAVDPPTPAIVIGQAPNLNGASWGGYPGWEEFNGVIRGIQIYSGLLSVSDVQAEIASPLSTAAGQGLIWYLNVNPRPDDVTDKKGTGTPHDPSWDGSPAALWTGP